MHCYTDPSATSLAMPRLETIRKRAYRDMPYAPPQTPVRIRTSGRIARPARHLAFSSFIAILALLFCDVSVAVAAAFDVNDTSWEGTSELLALARERLGHDRVRIVKKLDYGALKPADGVLILHPEVELEFREVSAFLAAGGRLAVLDDFGSADRFLAHYHVFRVQAPLRPAASLRDNAALAFAVPAVQAVAGQEQNLHPIVASVERIVTNHPSALTNPNLTPILTIPALGEPDATLAVTGVIASRGRLFAMADPSALVNLMLRYPGNRALAQGLVEYLVEDDSWGARGGALYILSNRLDQAGHFGRAEGLSGQLSQALSSASDALAALHQDGLPSPLALALGALTAVAALTWSGLSALRRHRQNQPRHALPTPLLAQGGIPGRAAVLAAATTDRALVVVELDALLTEELALHAGLPAGTSAAESLRALEVLGLPPKDTRTAQSLLEFGRRARESILRGRASRISAGQAAAHERRVNELLAALARRVAEGNLGISSAGR